MPYFGTDLKQFGYAATEKDTFSGDDSTVAFTLSKTSTTNDVEVFVGNVQQELTTFTFYIVVEQETQSYHQQT